jgi:hypothetical protein
VQAYRKTPPTVHVAQQRLTLVADFITRDEDTSAAAVGREHGVSRAQVYKLVGRATTALAPRSPGPAPGTVSVSVLQTRLATSEDARAAAQARIAELEQRLTRTIEVTRRRAHALELVLTVENVSQRGIQTIFDVAFDGQQRPSLGGLNTRLRTAGQTARQLLDTARAQVRGEVTCLMGDDIFFAGTPVKVVAEPRSVAILNLGRWPWHAAEDWALWLEEFGALQLFISDLGSDLLGAAADLNLPHQADFFHEMHWWEQKVFRPIDRDEQAAREQLRQCEERGVARPTARNRAEIEDAQALADQHEADFFQAYAALEAIRALFQPTQPDGTLWTDAAVDVAWDRIEQSLLAIRHPAGKRAARHVTKHGHRFTTHRRLLDAIAVDLRPGTAWSAHAVRQAVLQVWTLEAQAAANDTPIAESVAAQRRARRLRTALQRACRNLDAVEVALKRHCKYPPRSSSAVEALNSQLRVLQMVHRTVNDTLLSLVALAWNLTPRREGRRKGRSPYQMLGVDLGQGDRPWYDLLLDAQAA